MNGIDIAIGVLLAIGIIRGAVKGFINELASLVSVVAGIIGAYHFSSTIEAYLEQWFDWGSDYTQLAAFIITFIAIVAVITLIGNTLTKLVHYVALGIVNRLFGAVFGALRVVIVLLVVGVIFMSFNQNEFLVKKEKLQESIAYVFIEEKIIKYLPSLVEFAKEKEYISKDVDVKI